jgi:hypothetical protein
MQKGRHLEYRSTKRQLIPEDMGRLESISSEKTVAVSAYFAAVSIATHFFLFQTVI